MVIDPAASGKEGGRTVKYAEEDPALAAKLGAAAGAVAVPADGWRLIRVLPGRHVYRRQRKPEWYLCIGTTSRDARRFENAIRWARRLEHAIDAGRADWLARPRAGEWRTATVDGAPLLARPWLDGEELAPERRLSAAERRSLVARLPVLDRVLDGLASLTDGFPCSAPIQPRDHAGRFAEYLATTADRAVVDGQVAEELRALMDHALDLARPAPGLTHGELTPWHVLVCGTKLALLDLETMQACESPVVDVTVAVQRIWALQGARDLGLELARRRGAISAAGLLPPGDVWAWIFGATRTLAESLAWSDSADAREFLEWVLASARRALAAEA